MFGDTVKLAEAQPQSFTVDLVAVNGLKSVQLIGAATKTKGEVKNQNASIDISGGVNSKVLRQQALSGDSETITFNLPNASGWVALVVEDMQGHKAYSNPIWLKEVEKSQF